MVLSGQTIKRLGLVEPCERRAIDFGLSFGLGPAGYDVRCEFDAQGEQEEFIVKANGKVHLVSTIEFFRMPINVVGFPMDKSTWARKGLFVNNTDIEPGWSGFLTLELTNHGYEDIVLKRGMAISQIVFHFTDEDVENPYAGKYQNQRRGPVEAK